MSARHRLNLLAGVLVTLTPLAAQANPTAFRISDLDWRDPHFYVNFIGCHDITDTQLVGFSINSNMQGAIQTDGDMDGVLDENHLIVFNPLDQAGATGSLAFGAGNCTAPVAGTTCNTNASVVVYGTYTNMPTICLAPLAGTTKPYAPAITSATPPCFVAALGVVTLNVGGIPLTLKDTYLAATFVGFPATSLVNGLIRGFISETDANNTIIPASMALVGGQRLSSLWPGGTNCCAPGSDKDVNNGVTGWYCYLNFVASPVTFTGPTSVRGAPPVPLSLEAPAPNPFNPSTTIRYTLPAAGAVRLTIYDASGRMVAQLIDGSQSQGEQSARWNGRDARGAPVSSGVYFARLESNGDVQTTKLVLLK